MCSTAYTQLMVIKSKKLTATDGGHGNYYTLVGGPQNRKGWEALH